MLRVRWPGPPGRKPSDRKRMAKESGTNFCTGHFAPPEPDFGAELWETNFGRPNFGPEFLGRTVFPAKEAPGKFTLGKFHLPKITSQNSSSKNAPLEGHLADKEQKLAHGQKFSREAVGTWLVGATRLVVFPCPNRSFEKATSWTPSRAGTPCPLPLPKEVQEGGRSWPERGFRLEGG